MKRLFTALLSLAFLVPACSTTSTLDSYQRVNCHREGAYKRGYSDRTKGRKKDERPAELCPKDTREAVVRGYLDGWKAGEGKSAPDPKPRPLTP